MYACFVDYQKAFDNIWREGLYYKLMNAGVSSNIIKLIRDMYNENKQFPSIKGVKQGRIRPQPYSF